MNDTCAGSVCFNQTDAVLLFIYFLFCSGEMVAGQMISAVLLAPEDVGHVRSATVTFTQSDGSYFSWMRSAGTVKVSRAMVEGVNRRNT